MGRERTPGPGAYNANHNPVRTSAPAYTMGGKRTGARFVDGPPGPGTYTPKGFKNAPSFSLGGRFAYMPEGRFGNPGPGTYDADQRIQGPAFSLGPRMGQSHTHPSPGPGQYTIQTVVPGPYFSLGPRVIQPRGDLSRSPGPGAYTATDSLCSPRSPSYTMRPRIRRPGAGDGSPGPGAYTPRASHRGPAFSMLSRIGGHIGSARDAPGPGAYTCDAAHRAVSKMGPSYSLASRITGGASREVSPGPGAYTPRTRIAKDAPPAFSFGAKSPRPAPRDNTPGPGTYRPEKRDGSPSYSLGAKRRKDQVGSQNPGPGAYTPRIMYYNPVFSMARRVQGGKRSSYMPGPGAYEASQSAARVHGAGPAFSMGMRFKQQKGYGRNGNPGPGSYRVWRPAGGPSFGMGIGARFPQDF